MKHDRDNTSTFVTLRNRLAGVGWTLGASELWVAGQRAIPTWARGRMSAIVIMVSQGAIALGAVVWGYCGQAAGVSVALVVAAIALSFSLSLVAQLSIDCTTSLSFDPPRAMQLLMLFP